MNLLGRLNLFTIKFTPQKNIASLSRIIYRRSPVSREMDSGGWRAVMLMGRDFGNEEEGTASTKFRAPSVKMDFTRQ